MAERLSFFAPCPRGVEAMLAEELRRLRVRGVRPQRGGVLFSGSIADAYRVLLWSRLASRVLLSLGDVACDSADALYEGIRDIAWEDHVRADGTIAVDASGVNDALRNTQFTAVRVKDAVADRFRDRSGVRPSVDTASPDVRINVVVAGARAKIAIDLSGEPLHRRGYRRPGKQVIAPMKETLAAALLEVAGWREIAHACGSFADPLCGSGTIAIEAAMVATDMAPGILRSNWGFDRWLGHDEPAWAHLLDEADGRCETGRGSALSIQASDSDESALHIAADCIARAGLTKNIVLARTPLSEALPVAGAVSGLVACNPPYGERLSERAELAGLYRELSSAMGERFSGWTLAVITSDTRLAEGLGMTPVRVHELYNGRILAPVSVFASPEVTQPEPVVERVTQPEPAVERATLPEPAVERVAPDASAQAFENRLKKMAKHLGTWARRSGVTCYRVYDADLPDYNVAVDLYTSASDATPYVHVAEYAAPSAIDAAKAEQRLEWARVSSAAVLGASSDDVFLKRRERQRGSSQYERFARSGVVTTVAENGLLFEVNLSDYLDTGLFLDHRDTRAMIRKLAGGTRFLNLFAYTGTASVYAAAGGAASTTTVDLSATYTEWAGRNMELNGVSGPQHQRVQADVMQWLETARRNGNRYDLVFCDPPTFSNSKRMKDTWDVQRDHVGLIAATARVLAEDGTLVFSCNRRKFRLDDDALTAAGLVVEDITKRTIPKDFERSSAVHSCWIIRHG